MNNYVNELGVDSNNYYLDQYLNCFDEYDNAPTHEYYVEADIYYAEHEDINDDDGCLSVHLDGYIELKEGFEYQDLDDMPEVEKLEAVGFDKKSFPNCYEVIDVEWSIDC